MLLVKLWIDYRPLENLLCMKPHRLRITQGGKKKKDTSAAIFWNWKRNMRARSRFCLPDPLMSLAEGGNTIKHCFLCCVPEELQFAKCNLVSEGTRYSKCQP